jgi:hypothetical protein
VQSIVAGDNAAMNAPDADSALSRTLEEQRYDRRVLASGLRVLLPRNHHGTPLRVYRGTQVRERRLGTYGFFSTTKRAVAQRYCDGLNEWVRVERRRTGSINPLDRGVVIETIAPPQAILLVRTPIKAIPVRLSWIPSASTASGASREAQSDKV